MSTISVPINAQLEEFIEEQIKSGKASNKADVVRRAISLLRESEALKDLLEAEQEVREGKILRGDLRDLIKKIK